MSHTTNLREQDRAGSTTYSIITVDSTAPSKQESSDSVDCTGLAGWDVSPQPVRRSRLALYGNLAFLILPVAFLALAAAAYSFHGKPISAHGTTLQRVMLLGPTLFPLAFATLGGHSLKSVALWRAERGSTIGVLERLYGSQSFVSAVSLAVSLRSSSILSFAILMFWSLSPLGGQSSLRLLSEVNATVTTSREVYYPDPNAESCFLVNSMDGLNRVSAIISSSITTAETLQNSSVDVWNHPKVPRLRQLEQADRDNELKHSWIDAQAEKPFAYTSLLGLAILGLQTDTAANFTVPYEYMYVDCKAHMRASDDEILKFFHENFPNRKNGTSQLEPEWPFPAYSNLYPHRHLFDRAFYGPDSDFAYESSFFLVSPVNMTGHTAGYVFYGTKDEGSLTSLYKCSLDSLELEANIVCESAACRTAQLRRSLSPRPKPLDANNTLTGSNGRPWHVVKYVYPFQAFLRYIASIGGTAGSYSTHPVDNYVYGDLELSYFIGHNWSTISDSQISQGLTEIFNAYWDSSRWLNIAARTDPFAQSLIDKNANEAYSLFNLNQTSAVITRQIRIYKANLPWILTLVLCSGVLLVLGLTNIITSLQTSVPDIFGFVSSLTRGNPHVDLPEGDSYLDGADRARMVKNLSVQLGDVQSGEEVGYLTLRSVEKGDFDDKIRLEKGRLFR